MSTSSRRYPAPPSYQTASAEATTTRGTRVVRLSRCGAFGYGAPCWLVSAFDDALPASDPSSERREYPWTAKGEAQARAEYERRRAALLTAEVAS